jgi:anti-anti-sigma factor
MGQQLKFEHQTSDGLRIVRVHGEVDMSTAVLFADAIGAEDLCIVDLTGCRYIDSSGLAVLIAMYKAHGKGIPVVTPQGSFFRKLVHIAGIDKFLTLFENVEQALAGDRQSPATPKAATETA